MRKQIAFPELVLSLEENQLGLLRETYRTRATRAGWIAFWIFTPLILLLIGGAIGLVLWGSLPLLNEPFFWSPMTVIMGIAAPILFIVVLPFFLFWQMRTEDRLITPLRRKIVVSLYTNGLLYREGRKQHVVLWEQIRFVERLSMHPQSARYQIQVENGTQITLSVAIAEVQKLGTAIEQEVVKLLLPQMLEDYADQKPIVFPGLCLSQDMIRKSDESLPWQDVERIHFRSSKVTGSEQFAIQERGVTKDWFTAPLTQFRNLCVLEALLERISQEKHFSIDTSLPQRSRKNGRERNQLMSEL
jgi:hypothetical protein